MISPERLESMQQQWVLLLAEFKITPATAYPFFDRLVSAYSEPHRHYHTLEHLAEMFRVANRLMKPEDARYAILLAIWYHDCVYDPQHDDNEVQSAIYAARDMEELGIEPSIQDHVIRLIHTTQHDIIHEPVPGYTVLCDADLAILGASEQRYDRYAQDIRKEYNHVPDEAYRIGRTRSLKAILNSKTSIYHSKIMYDEGAEAAVANITGEISRLAAHE